MSREFAKRSADLVLGTALLLAVLPLIAVIALGTAVVLRTWPFFTQTRVGRDGKPFRFIKLRTLPTSAPAYASKYDLAHVDVPKFSQTLRRLHLDELPQLFHVVTGKMSLVGPRPEMAFLSPEYGESFERERTSVRPGCTGLWQVSEHCTSMIYEHPEFDRYYVANSSLRLDLWIIGRTIRTFLAGGRNQLVTMDTLPAWAGAAPAELPTATAGVDRLHTPRTARPLPRTVDLRVDSTLEPVAV